MENKKRAYKRYLWSGNADTHAKAIRSFAMLATVPASLTTMGGMVAIIYGYGVREREAMVVLFVAYCLSWVFVWCCMTFSAVVGYAYLMEMQVEASGEDRPSVSRTYVQRERGYSLGVSGVGEGGVLLSGATVRLLLTAAILFVTVLIVLLS